MLLYVLLLKIAKKSSPKLSLNLKVQAHMVILNFPGTKSGY